MLSPNPPSDLDEDLVAATLQAFDLDDETISGIVRDIRSKRESAERMTSSSNASAAPQQQQQSSTEQRDRVDYNMRSAGASSSSHSGAASSVEIAHDNATIASDRSSRGHAQLETLHRRKLAESTNFTHTTHSTKKRGVAASGSDIDRSSLQKSVDSLCSRLASIEDPYDRRHLSMKGTAVDTTEAPYGSSNFHFLSSDQDDQMHHRPIVFPEDSKNRISSQYVTHKEWCPAQQDSRHRAMKIHGDIHDRGCREASCAPKYFDPENIKRWIHKEFTPRVGCKVASTALIGTSKRDVIFGDEVFRTKGDANPTAQHTSVSDRHRFSRVPSSQQRIVGGHKMALAHCESTKRSSSSLACSHYCPSSLPRSFQTDKVSRLHEYRRAWDNDHALKGVLGKRDATSWEIRTQLDDYRRHVW
jgi:hypothetical protein